MKTRGLMVLLGPRIMGAHLVGVVLPALACSRRDSKRPPPATATPSQVTPSPDSAPAPSPQPPDILRVLYERLRAMGEDRVAVRSRLGEPPRATTQAQPNIHDAAATDTVVQWTYDHLRFQFLVVGGRDFLVETRAATDHPAMAPLIGPFSTLDAAEATLGAPGWSTALGDTMVNGYRIPEPAIGVSQNTVNLYFVRGRLVFVSAVPYVD